MSLLTIFGCALLIVVLFTATWVAITHDTKVNPVFLPDPADVDTPYMAFDLADLEDYLAAHAFTMPYHKKYKGNGLFHIHDHYGVHIASVRCFFPAQCTDLQMRLWRVNKCNS